ncbi:MAG: peptidoglycan-binding protein, partial [Oscillospiraceae bacterium]|nr:peptidoglycan-binding protein [Oscillospiraceae bacterium]
FFDVNMETAVKNFQRIFNLTPDGIVGKATWYKIKSIFNGIKGLAELQSEGLTQGETARVYAKALQPGDEGVQVKLIQYYLSVLAFFDENLPMPSGTGVYDAKTENAVREFQAQQGLAVDGIVGRQTWNALLAAYDRTIASIPAEYLTSADEIYPGKFLALGQSGTDVESLQKFLLQAAQAEPALPKVEVTGTYDAQTAAAIRAVQEMEGLPQNGVTGPLTWDAVVSLAKRGRAASAAS